MMHNRRLGRTEVEVSPIAFGGAPIGLANYLGRWDPDDATDELLAINAVTTALGHGINYLDTALSYGQGRSEQMMGAALRQSGRSAFVATKTPKRTYDGVMETAETSLKNLGVATIDLLQFHGGKWSEEETTTVLSGGGIEAMNELRRAGKIRFTGFTAEIGSPGTYQLLRSGHFDVMQIAYNVLYQDACNLMVSAGPIIEAHERGMGVVTMRSLTSGVVQRLFQAGFPMVEPNFDLHAFCLNFVLSNPYVHSAVVGMRTADEVVKNVAIAENDAMRLDLTEIHRRYM